MGYLKKFEALVKDLKKYEFLEVVEFTPQPPVSAAALKTAEKAFGAALAPAIREFYGESNGLKLHWQVKPDVSPELAKQLRKKSSDYYVEIAEYVGNPFAIINLIPLNEVVGKKWKELGLGAHPDEIEFAGETYKFDELRKRLKPFDVMNREFCMTFFLEKGNGNPKVLLLSEGYTNWTDSRFTDFASYMEMLLVTRGIAEAREKIFSESNGITKPPLAGDGKFWQKYVPKLFI
jgi:hypothetical protein